MSLRVEIHSALFDEHRRNRIVQAVAQELRATVSWVETNLPLEAAFDLSRHQYHSTALLNELIRKTSSANPSEKKLIALVDVDLFIPVLTFVFGEAQLSGACAVVSTVRLRHEF